MNSKLSTGAGALVLVALFSACGERVEAGLANAPSMGRKTEPRGQHDVVTTGDEGCTSRTGGTSAAAAAGACPQAGVPLVADGGALLPPN